MNPLIDLRSGRTRKIATIFEVSELLGTGHFAEVYKAYNRMSKTDLAIKIYLNHDEHTRTLAENEIDLLQKLDDLKTDFFPAPKGGLRSQKIGNHNHPLIPMELCEYSDQDAKKRKTISLNNILDQIGSKPRPELYLPDFWNQNLLFNFILYLCDAVRLIHKKDIIHRDLKPSNILIKKPYGEESFLPFIIDFNTSTRSWSQMSTGGTNNYLPPEVITEERTKPDQADDLWAIAKIISEILYGKSFKLKKDINTHNLIEYKIPDQISHILIKALSPAPEDRYENAEELYNKFESCINKIIRGKHEDNYVSSDEIIWARENKKRILRDIIKTLGGENELPVLKETKDAVSFIFSSLSQDTTKSSHLEDEILRLGTDAIPAIIEESFKLLPESDDFIKISKALATLAKTDLNLAKRAIELYCVSSDYNVRRMCQCLCDDIEYLPTNLIESIVDNDSLYLPDERVNIADICIKHSTDSNTMMSLNMYMCREYIIDQQKYPDLKYKIALRVNELKFKEKAGLIVGDTKMRVWEDLNEYAGLSKVLKDRVDNGLKELFADAFSSLKEEALEYIKDKKLPSFCHLNKIPIARTFIGKLAKEYMPARQWLFDELKRKPDKDLLFAAQRLKSEFTDNEKNLFIQSARSLNIRIDEEFDLKVLFNKYLDTGFHASKYQLCNKGKKETLNLIKSQITQEKDSVKIRRILKLIENYRNKEREIIVDLLLDNWELFADYEYILLIYVLTEYKMPNKIILKRAIETLEKDLNFPEKKNHARTGIDRLLRA